jgi:hypothetical protein
MSGSGHQEPPTFPTAKAELASIADAGAQNQIAAPRQHQSSYGSPGSAQSSLSSFHGSVRSPFAIRAMLSTDTLRSERSDAAEVGPADPALVRQRLLAAPWPGGSISPAGTSHPHRLSVVLGVG